MHAVERRSRIEELLERTRERGGVRVVRGQYPPAREIEAPAKARRIPYVLDVPRSWVEMRNLVPRDRR